PLLANKLLYLLLIFIKPVKVLIIIIKLKTFEFNLFTLIVIAGQLA
ncbi:MAG: hypothetical protein QG635_2277, partial [Bacteroidota bacterium]|nr:hypothetical protein [Bacteroidota bacterium]